ncbi:sigma-54 dependent transcriptional regulator [Rheinheimera sp.]|jgi:two-component system response regulator FlrC|uniref:sigma-54-dependent transcriptional regulator n=1 Tax=Rheinheimera sp. TaxID=1869214 RepID=UPI0026063994|nr:sigma-54 dependent transcriptional regulator [Rheinheimera sp.]MCA1929430.1 sigma-54 dependent transcriptional regulator [Rheinheimera sp.]
MQTTSILVVEDDAGLREALCDTLSLANYQVVPAQSAEQGLQLLKEHKISLLISDVQMGTMSGLDLLKTVKLNYPALPVLMMTAYANVNDAVVAIRNGAVDYLAKPFSPEVLINMVSRYALGNEVATIEPVVHSEQGKQLVKLAAKVARSDANVLVLGPSGSGKEVLARYIHQQSGRTDGPFVAINCAAIPENMLEATLFGYEKGAFTGAIQSCPGKFEQAQQGTILLDEISEMDLNLQAKLLRVLQEREVERLGARKTIKLDVRVIATSNRDLKQAVAEGKFREDLYYRLNVFPLTWTALAERPADIVPLAMHLLERHCRSTGMPQPSLSYAAQHKLMQHYWPGNVRELDNIVQRALIICDGDQINAADILLESAPTMMDSMPDAAFGQHAEQDVSLFKSEIYEQEHRIILETMRACANSRKEVAERLGISARTLRYKLARMRESGIQLPA